jgi:VIT1/CCC1 family predicted Fe2+/Mn2+ transporter
MMPDMPSVTPKSDPLRHREDARRRAQLALYFGESHHLPGGGYLPGATEELLRGALIGGCVLAAGCSLPLGGAQIFAIFVAVVFGHAFTKGVMTARASARQIDFYRREIRREAREIEEDPAGERRELEALYEAKGLRGPLLRETVDQICADPETLLKVMMEEELGIFTTRFEHPALQATIDGIASLLGALPVGVAFALTAGQSGSPELQGIPYLALGLWLFSMALFGAIRSRYTQEPFLEAAAVSIGLALACGGFTYFFGRAVAVLFLTG